jgi:prepilin-type processing-associated H-X9-DG protein
MRSRHYTTGDMSVSGSIFRRRYRRGDRHSGFVNVAYCDGHVKAVKGSTMWKELVLTGVTNKFTGYRADAGDCTDATKNNYPQ